MIALLRIRVCKTSLASPHRYQRRNVSFDSLFRRGIKFFFKENLLLTNSLTSGACMAIGDLIQQEIEYQSKIIFKRYDWERVGRMLLVGTLVGPAHHFYYIYLDKLMPKANVKTVFRKVVCDQLIASPLTILFFFYAMGYLEKKTIAQCHEEIWIKFQYVVMADWIFWPPVQIVNFYFLPTQYRVVYINVATMIFNIYMSYMKHYDQHLQLDDILKIEETTELTSIPNLVPELVTDHPICDASRHQP